MDVRDCGYDGGVSNTYNLQVTFIHIEKQKNCVLSSLLYFPYNLTLCLCVNDTGFTKRTQEGVLMI